MLYTAVTFLSLASATTLVTSASEKKPVFLRSEARLWFTNTDPST